ncbi:MAG: hypothetical protein RBR06_01920 [Desulfuromonadaceae bacterium]|nr:hypothetical protein [Desulfuromonadaceae bacterium]
MSNHAVGSSRQAEIDIFDELDDVDFEEEYVDETAYVENHAYMYNSNTRTPLQKFEDWMGREPTAQEREVFHDLQRNFDLEDDDTLWVILVGLEYYLTLYKEIPERISDQISTNIAETISKVKKLAESETDSLFVHAQNIYLDLDNYHHKLKINAQRSIRKSVQEEILRLRKEYRRNCVSYIAVGTLFFTIAWAGVKAGLL